ncbi:hypothetical protein KAU11_09625 [Candidatus Babeliales bacterium]|nr:hypothetical protein [Candidatus Babeliales bacterium]
MLTRRNTLKMMACAVSVPFLTNKVSDRNYKLKDHKPCAVGRMRGFEMTIGSSCSNCSKCVYLEGCRAGYEGHEIGDPYRDKQLFKMVNPNA